uniref:Uncharacterized protein n=1 Tax=Myripristis murdjan TaxID=586833 RepID=A0A668A1D2_9TELE
RNILQFFLWSFIYLFFKTLVSINPPATPPPRISSLHSVPNHCHLSAIIEWTAHFRVGKTSELSRHARGAGALSQVKSPAPQGHSVIIDPKALNIAGKIYQRKMGLNI